MPTFITNGLLNNADTSVIRSGSLFISSSLSASGWVPTSDTGQTLDWNSFNYNSYQIWKSTDALSSTAPIYLKWEAISDNGNSFRITVGFGTSGAGVITGSNVASVQVRTNFNNGSQPPGSCVASGGPGRFAIAFWHNMPSQDRYGLVWGVERTKDVNGNDTAEGVLLIGGGDGYYENGTVNSYIGSQQYVPVTGSMGSKERIQGNFGGLIKNYVGSGYGNKLYVTPIMPFAEQPKYPGRNFLIYSSNDIPATTVVPVSMYGTSSLYFAVGKNIRSVMVANLANGNGDYAGSLLMRWE